MTGTQKLPNIAIGFVLLLLLPLVLAGVDINLGPATPYTVRLKLWNEPWLYAAGLALFLFLVDQRQTREKWFALGLTDSLIIGFLILQSVWLSRMVAADPASADLHLMRGLFALMLGVAAYYGMRVYRARFAMPVYGAVIAGAVLVVPFVLVFLYFNPESRALGDGLKWRVPGFGPVRIFGITQEAGIIVATVLLATNRLEWRRWLLWLALVSMWAILFWSGGRGAILSIAVSLALLSVLAPGYFIALWRVLLIGGLVGAGLSLLIWAPEGGNFGLKSMIVDSVRSGANSISAGRLDRWAETLDLALQKPVFGHGLNQVSNLWPSFAISDEAAGTAGKMPFYFLSYRNAHNLVVEVLLAWGILGGLGFFWLVAKGWFKAVGRLLQATEVDRLAAFAGLSALAVHSMFAGVYIFPSALIYLAVFFGISLAPSAAQNGNTNG